MDWKPMSEHQFPWEHRDMIVMAFAKDDLADVDIFRCTCAEHGALFPKNTTFLSIIEQGWIPFAWCIDDSPEREDAKFPPMWTDYLTESLRD